MGKQYYEIVYFVNELLDTYKNDDQGSRNSRHYERLAYHKGILPRTALTRLRCKQVIQYMTIKIVAIFVKQLTVTVTPAYEPESNIICRQACEGLEQRKSIMGLEKFQK